MTSNKYIHSVEHATGIGWSDWLQFMDQIGAKNLPHKEIARKVYEKLKGKNKNPGWWSQSITVAYEQYIGRRLPGQRQDGTFEVSISRPTKLGMQDLMEKWAKFASKNQLIKNINLGDVRRSGTEKRLHWRIKATNSSTVTITSELKNKETASILVTLSNHKTQTNAQAAKSKWVAILDQFLNY